MLEGIIQRGAS